MQLAEVLAAVPGLKKRFVHYLEAHQYITPAKVPKARIARRDYSAADLAVIRETWRYHQQGFPVQRAHELATQTRAQAVLLLDLPAARVRETAEALRRIDRVVELAPVYGASANLLARVEAAHESDVYGVLVHVLERTPVLATPTLLRLAARGPLPPPRGGKVLAYVLIKVPAKQIGGVLEALKGFDGISEASVVYGETDIFAKVEVADQAELDRVVVEQIQGIAAVESTRTFIAIGGMRWTR